jgi:hypothetical protein
VIGSLLWIARATRPDILYAVIYLARFSACYEEAHFAAAKRIIRYLVTTVDRKLTYRKQETCPMDLIVYSDSDWASDKNDRKSFAGFVVYLNRCPISWGCKKQVTVALSSTEAEYMALSDATREILYVVQLLTEFVHLVRPVALNIDNKGAGHIAENNVNNKLTKHIDVRYHFVREHIESGLVELFYVPTAFNIADIFTKALGADVFEKLRDMVLGI